MLSIQYQSLAKIYSINLNIDVLMDLILFYCQHMNGYTLSIKTMKEKAKKEVDIVPRTANLSFVRENISESNRKRGDKKEEARLREMPKEKNVFK